MTAAIIFDLLRLASEQFWLFGPALAALYCQQKLSPVLGETLSASVCATGATYAGMNATPLFMLFGTVLGIAVGILGWLTVASIIFFTNERLVKESISNVFWIAGSLLVTETPIVGSLPALSVTVYKLYSAQIKKEKELAQNHLNQQAQEAKEARSERVVSILQAKRTQLLAKTQQEQALQEEVVAQTEEEIPDNRRAAA